MESDRTSFISRVTGPMHVEEFKLARYSNTVLCKIQIYYHCNIVSFSLDIKSLHTQIYNEIHMFYITNKVELINN